MFTKRVLLISMALISLSQLPSSVFAQTFLTAWGSYGSGEGQFLAPQGVAVGGSGNVYVSDGDNNRVQVFTSGGTYLRQWSVPGTPGQALNIAVDKDDNVYVGAFLDLMIYRFTSSGVLVTQWPGDISLAVDASGSVYAVNGDRVQVFSPSGVLIREWGTSGYGGGQPTWGDGVAVDASGSVYVADKNNSRIEKFTNVGTYITQWGSSGAGDGQFGNDSPVRVAVGSDGNVFVVDYGNSRVQEFTSGGIFLAKWGSFGHSAGQFSEPIGVAVDAYGDVYVADKTNYRIQKFGSAPTPVASVTWGSVKARYRGQPTASQPIAEGR